MAKNESDLLPGPRRPQVSTSIAFEADILEWLDEVADEKDRSRSNMVNEILARVRDQEAAKSA